MFMCPIREPLFMAMILPCARRRPRREPFWGAKPAIQPPRGRYASSPPARERERERERERKE
jgi:hypothetical protein